MLSLLLALALGAGTHPAAKPKPTPRPSPAPALHAVTVASLTPAESHVGQNVTIVGSGFDQGSVVLVGDLAPRIVEKSATKIVFHAPKDPKHPDGYKSDVFVVTPGLPLLYAGTVYVELVAPLGFVTGGVKTGATTAAGPPIVLDEQISVSSTAPRTFTFDLQGSNAATVVLSCKGGDVSLEAHPSGKSEPSLSTESLEGTLNWTLRQRTLGGTAEAPVGKVDLKVTTGSAAPLACSMRIARTIVPVAPK